MKEKEAHHLLCLLAARWLNSVESKTNYLQPTCNWVCVEVGSLSTSTPDVFGWGDGNGTGYAGVQIEVKMSHADFLRDKKKKTTLNPQLDFGMLKYYCCPKGVISVNEIPPWCGLLYEDDGRISVIRDANKRDDKCLSSEVLVISSAMRRLGIKPEIIDALKK
jgi:hypothetical protein